MLAQLRTFYFKKWFISLNSRCERAEWIDEDEDGGMHRLDTLGARPDPTGWIAAIDIVLALVMIYCASLLVLTVFLTTTIWDTGFRDSLLVQPTPNQFNRW
jgi:hypothetical protein